MAVTVVATGSITPGALNTETNFAGADTTARNAVQLLADMTNLVAGDSGEVTAYVTVGSNERVWRRVALTGLQSDEVAKMSIPFMSARSYRFTWKQTTGTLRAIPFDIVAA